MKEPDMRSAAKLAVVLGALGLTLFVGIRFAPHPSPACERACEKLRALGCEEGSYGIIDPGPQYCIEIFAHPERTDDVLLGRVAMPKDVNARCEAIANAKTGGDVVKAGSPCAGYCGPGHSAQYHCGDFPGFDSLF